MSISMRWSGYPAGEGTCGLRSCRDICPAGMFPKFRVKDVLVQVDVTNTYIIVSLLTQVAVSLQTVLRNLYPHDKRSM